MAYQNATCIEKALTDLKKSFPNSLRNHKNMGIYTALVAATYYALNGRDRLQIDDHFAYSHQWRGNDIIANVASFLISAAKAGRSVTGFLFKKL